MNWFYESAGQPTGPISDEELDRLISEGKVIAGTRVWREGLGEWQPLSIARPSRSQSQPVEAGASPNLGDAVACASCGKFYPPSQVVQIGGRAICSNCKPAVLQELQQGGVLPSGGFERTGPPWERRKEIGVMRAVMETVQEALLRPGVTFETMKRTGGIGSPYLYFLLLGFICGGVTLIYAAILGARFNHMFMPANYTPPPGMENFMKYSQSPYYALSINAVILVFWMPLCPFVFGGIIHLFLMMYGGAKGGFEVTFRAFCYAWGSTYVFDLIPACGATIHMVWGIVAMCLALGPAHETTTGKAVGAVLSPFIACCGAIVLLYGTLFAILFSAMSQHSAH